jgi:alkylation response protein AidB-like acyl-CoA dehydrogenase
MGRDGWIGVGWPKEFGGRGRGATEQIAFITEMANAGAPVQAHSTGESIVAHALFSHGTKAQQDEWLSAIRRGERTFALGYSEPEAGSDLAALRARRIATATTGSSTDKSRGQPAATRRVHMACRAD